MHKFNKYFKKFGKKSYTTAKPVKHDNHQSIEIFIKVSQWLSNGLYSFVLCLVLGTEVWPRASCTINKHHTTVINTPSCVESKENWSDKKRWGFLGKKWKLVTYLRSSIRRIQDKSRIFCCVRNQIHYVIVKDLKRPFFTTSQNKLKSVPKKIIIRVDWNIQH